MKKILFLISLTISISTSKNSNVSIIKSLILPGWGQLSENQSNSAKKFFIQEGVMWFSFFGSIWTSDYYEQSYLTFAKENAEIDLRGLDLQMAVDVGNYSNLIEYNDNKQRRRQFNLVLDENDINNHWQWNSDANREKFKNMRINSGLSKKFSSFMIAGLIGHRIISGIHVKYIQNKKIPNIGYNFYNDGSKSVKLIWNF
ncbi:MAG: hypothetical protein CMF96_07445 [Candidatus Marinimicrobia bacterium]|nr:hypothetical protein [Candidatus Neomarinimicrobiota bacterium]